MTDHPPSVPRHRLLIVPTLGAVAVLAGVALSDAAAPPPRTLAVATHVTVAGRSESIVTNRRGLAVYTLSGESGHRLKCTRSSGCLSAWPPVTVPGASTKLSAAHGIRGRLAVLHRDGVFQLTLGGHPLYTFVGDGGRRRTVTGQGIVSFGGTWKVVAVSAGTPHTTSTTSSSTASAPSGY